MPSASVVEVVSRLHEPPPLTVAVPTSPKSVRLTVMVELGVPVPRRISVWSVVISSVDELPVSVVIAVMRGCRR
jgi:hypothetical protein